MTKMLSEEIAWKLLARGKIGRLGCLTDGEPYVVPINYVADDDSIYGHSLPGKKISALRAQPRVCFQVDEIENDFAWRSVIAYGKFEEMRGPAERGTILSKLFERFPLLTPVESVMAKDAGAPNSVVFRIAVDRISGVEEG